MFYKKPQISNDLIRSLRSFYVDLNFNWVTIVLGQGK